MPFDYTSGNPDSLVGGGPARMQDIQGPFYDIRAYLNSAAGGGGSGLPVLTAVPVLEVGMTGQMRAGRQLVNADFTSLGLSIPTALWNLHDLTDVSGNGRALTNKGAVTFGDGINGQAATAAQFTGSVAQALYIADAGAADPLRIRTGSWGAWFRTAKRGTSQYILAKYSTTAGARAYGLYVDGTTNTLAAIVSPDGSGGGAVTGAVDVTDDRWHFGVATYDGNVLNTYVDGVHDARLSLSGAIFPGTAPLDIGAAMADGGAAAISPCFGRVDEAFVTGDVLNEDQVRCLYAAELTHTLGAQPAGATISVRRCRKGAALAVADFPLQPLRLHNFTGQSLADEGSAGAALTLTGSNVIVASTGADGSRDGGRVFSTAVHTGMTATDAGLPNALTPRSYGCWFATAFLPASGHNLMSWGTSTTADARVLISNVGVLSVWSGADAIASTRFVADGLWHFLVVTEDNVATDGVKRKLYLDGKLLDGSTVMNAITLSGATGFRVGANPTGGGPFTGAVDGVFVCGYALTSSQVHALYAKGAPDLGASPKNAGDHIERIDDSSILFIGDTLEPQWTVDLGVLA